MRRFDMSALRRLYPLAPPITKVRMDALRRDYSQCDTRFSNVQTVSSAAAEAVVRVDFVEVCKRKTAQRAIETDGRHEFHLVKGPSGDWIIRELFTR